MLEVSGLEVRYGDAQALSGVSLAVHRGEIVSVVGANGAGKTTLIRAIHGMVPAHAGSISYGGRAIRGWRPDQVGELGLAQVAEGRQIFPVLSVQENLELGAILKRARAQEAKNLERVFAMFPRLKERRGQDAGTLSGGEQQMLAIGRCLMSNPEFIMFDEPSLGLAPTLVNLVFDVIRQLNESGLTVLLVEQNVVESLELCRRAYVMENGEIVLEGEGAALLVDDRVRAAYLGI
ncbi:MAG: ABC transporter ATP-binding protein [Betaproteobacteria bacterium]|nr:ABC transporter ATP-binding protein [Betaproteobacteria bacterium]